MDRKNINRGFKKLRVWQDAVSLYILAYKVFANFPFELKKVAANCIDASHSISRNISEGYCRRSLKEYLNHLNIALGSCGEFHSCYVSFKKAGQISDAKYTSRNFYNLLKIGYFFEASVFASHME
jgi:four helix bundle protein